MPSLVNPAEQPLRTERVIERVRVERPLPQPHNAPQLSQRRLAQNRRYAPAPPTLPRRSCHRFALLHYSFRNLHASSSRSRSRADRRLRRHRSRPNRRLPLPSKSKARSPSALRSPRLSAMRRIHQRPGRRAHHCPLLRRSLRRLPCRRRPHRACAGDTRCSAAAEAPPPSERAILAAAPLPITPVALPPAPCPPHRVRSPKASPGSRRRLSPCLLHAPNCNVRPTRYRRPCRRPLQRA